MDEKPYKSPPPPSTSRSVLRIVLGVLVGLLALFIAVACLMFYGEYREYREYERHEHERYERNQKIAPSRAGARD